MTRRRKVTREGYLVPYGWKRPPSAAALAARKHRSTAAWQRVRAEHLAREPACRDCEGVYDLTVDHIRRLALGGTDDPANLRTLCRRCNGRRSALQTQGMNAL